MPPRRVLVVDDAAVMRRLLAAVLTGPDYEVAGSAGDGQEALGRIEALRPDLVTVDLEMPGMDGLQLLDRMQARWPDLPAFVVAAATDQGCRAAQIAVARGAADYVAKPSHSASLERTLEELRQTLLPRLLAHGRPPAPQNVLVVDDGSVNRMLLSRMVEAHGSTVATATDGLEAVAAAAATTYDVIFMDCEMPRMDGLTAAREIRLLSGQRPVIIGITGDDRAAMRDACLAAGMDDLMFKPFHQNFVRLMLGRPDLRTEAASPHA